MRVAGAVLTGGVSRRMGSDKALLEVGGTAMSARVAAALTGAGCSPVVAVGGAAADLRSLGLDVVADAHPGEGPLGGILTALDALADRCDAVMVVACDLPFVDSAVIAAVIEALGSHEVAAGRAGGPLPLCAVWSMRATAHLQARFDAGERAVHRAAVGLDLVEVVVDAGSLRNVNTPDDLAAVRLDAGQGRSTTNR